MTLLTGLSDKPITWTTEVRWSCIKKCIQSKLDKKCLGFTNDGTLMDTEKALLMHGKKFKIKKS